MILLILASGQLHRFSRLSASHEVNQLLLVDKLLFLINKIQVLEYEPLEWVTLTPNPICCLLGCTLMTE